jgi:hypothetical protein
VQCGCRSLRRGKKRPELQYSLPQQDRGKRLPVFGIVTGAGSDTAGAVIRGKGVSGRADRDRSGGARRRWAQHRRGRERGCRARCVRGRYRNDLRADRDGSDHSADERESTEQRAGLWQKGRLLATGPNGLLFQALSIFSKHGLASGFQSSDRLGCLLSHYRFGAYLDRRPSGASEAA